MKKIIVILIIIISIIPFIIRKNDYNDITNTLNVNSIGFDYNIKTNEYEIYFYFVNSFNLANSKISSSNIDNLSYVIKVSNNNFEKAFNDIFYKVNEFVNFSHLKSVLFSINFLNSKNLNKFYNLIKNNTRFYYNFYIFTTNSSIFDIYNIDNISDVSAYHTILITPNLLNSYKLVPFNIFTSLIIDSSYSLLIPNIELIDDSLSNNNKNLKSLEINGYSYFNRNNFIKTLIISDNKYYKWFTNLNEQNIVIDYYNLYVKTFKYKIVNKHKKLIIKYKISAVLISSLENLQITDIEEILNEKISSEIRTMYNNLENENIDIYNLKYYYSDDLIKNVKFEVDLELN